MRIQPIEQNFTFTAKKPATPNVPDINPGLIEDMMQRIHAIENDTCLFDKTDRTLYTYFLNDLLHRVGGIKSFKTKCEIIKEKFLERMGYRYPEAFQIYITKNDDNSRAAFVPLYGIMKIKDNVFSDAELIAAIRHELEHLNQDVKLYKAMGKKMFLKCILAVLKQKDPNITMSEINAKFNNQFYKIMAKDVDITNFDSKKYYDATCEYPLSLKKFSLEYKYYNNLLEKDAIEVQKKVLKVLGKDPVVSADFFPKNYETMIGLLEKSKFPPEKYDSLLYELQILTHMDNLDSSEDFAKFFNIWMDLKSNNDVAPSDENWWKTKTNYILNKNKKPTLESVESEQKRYQIMEELLREGKYTVADALNWFLSQ